MRWRDFRSLPLPTTSFRFGRSFQVLTQSYEAHHRDTNEQKTLQRYKSWEFEPEEQPCRQPLEQNYSHTVRYRHGEVIVSLVIGKTKFSPFELRATALTSIFFLGKSSGSRNTEYGAPVSTP